MIFACYVIIFLQKKNHCATTYYLMIEKKETVMKHEHVEKINSG